jgi:transposase-like protein
MTLDLTDPVFTNERKAREYFEAIRWPSGVVCPHCGNADQKRLYPIAANTKHGVRDGLRECQDCGGQFTVMTRSVMESSHLPLTKWALAYRLMASAKKGISAHQMHRTLKITYKTAWFLCHRIREAMRDVSGGELGGPGKIVEADEVYIGGKPRPGGVSGHKTKSDRKVPVAVLVERGGRSRATVVQHPLDGALKRNIYANVKRGTEMHTDEHKGYQQLHRTTGGLHFVVTHKTGEYAKEDIHVNTAESWNALLKRSIYGSFHHVSVEHLSRYCDEVSFRWDRREIDDTKRTEQAIKGGDQKRLTYRRSSTEQPPEA